MKKIIVAICGIILSGGAMAAAQDVAQLSQYPNDWKLTGPYNKLPNPTNEYVFYDRNYSQFGKNEIKGTYGNDEGAMVALMAQEIYKNGAKICATQIQAANADFTASIWIDYHFDKEKHTCITLCKSGWSGSKCETHEISTSSCDSAPTFGTETGTYFAGQLTKLLTSGKDNYKITKEVQVFDQDNHFNTSDSREAYAVVLGVVRNLTHGLKVAPVRIDVERSRTWNGTVTSWITSAKTNGLTTILCAAGYVEQNDNCVLAEECQPGYKRTCSGYETGFDEDQHTWDIDVENDCKYFICKEGSDYAFKPGTTKECKKCERTAHQGIVKGVCKDCEDRILVGEQCKGYTPISPKELLDGMFDIGKCWMKSSLSEYKSCVRCSNGQKWNDSTKRCE
ncbi:MAG: hypothetical protein J5714_03155 [Alphaproteobacteria bacterium]|nr:hypothetical protein [Alphaproteobacteria bacterium]